MRRGVIVVCVANIPTAVRITTHTRRGPNEIFGLPTTLTTRLHSKGESETAMAKSRGRMVSHCRRSPRHCRHGRKKPCPDAVRPIVTVDAAAGPGRCSCAHLDGSEGDLGRGARQETRIGAIDAKSILA